MAMRELVQLATLMLFLGSGLAGWALCGMAHLSYRYFPALAQAGTAIGLWPTYLLMVAVGRKLGFGLPSETWGLWSAFAVATAVMVLSLLALRLAFLEWVKELNTA
jgi:hypothetical protein